MLIGLVLVIVAVKVTVAVRAIDFNYIEGAPHDKYPFY